MGRKKTFFFVRFQASGNDFAGGTGDGDKSVPAPSYRVIGQPEDLYGAMEFLVNDRCG